MADSYWLSEPAPALVSRPLTGVADVEIVGGGVTGISCALTLAQAGKRVRLHEARAVASGASGRNGGFALRGGAMAYDSAREWLGHEQAAEYWRLTEAYVGRMGKLGGGAFRRTGSLRLAGDDEREELRAEYEALREDGFAAEWRDELPEPLAGRFPGALFHPDDAVLQPARLVRRMAGLAAEAGVEIREHDRVEDLDALEAETIVVATDGYPSGLLGELEGLIIPTRGQMIATEPLPERLFPMPHYGRHGYDYWHQDEEGTDPRGRLPRLRPRVRVHDLGGDDAADPGRARRLRRADPRPPARSDASLGRSLRARARPDAGRRPSARTRRPLDGRRLLRARQRAGPDVRRPRREGDPRRSAFAARADGSGAARRLEREPRSAANWRSLTRRR